MKIMHVIDSLDAGGSERVAVNYVNLLAERGHDVCLCVTRKDGVLSQLINKEKVDIFYLKKRSKFDIEALKRFINFVNINNIEIIHAHSSSVFLVSITKFFFPKVSVVWHKHIGLLKNYWVYKIFTRNIQGIIVLNQEMKNWIISKLKFRKDSVWVIPNFYYHNYLKHEDVDVPGVKGYRIVCVANFRSEKNHLLLLEAFKKVLLKESNASLLLLGKIVERNYFQNIFNYIKKNQLETKVHILNNEFNVMPKVSACDIGVLSSVFEGFPLALIEYGIAGLAAITTDVGCCREVLDDGEVGVIVEPNNADLLAKGLIGLLKDSHIRNQFSKKFKQRINKFYNSKAAVTQVEKIYQKASL